jgi:hypothetical protein
VPRDSAVIGLSGEREHAVRLNAEHSDMCRFDLSIQNDEDNYQLVEANLEELCTEALKQGERLISLRESLPAAPVAEPSDR